MEAGVFGESGEEYFGVSDPQDHIQCLDVIGHSAFFREHKAQALDHRMDVYNSLTSTRHRFQHYAASWYSLIAGSSTEHGCWKCVLSFFGPQLSVIEYLPIFQVFLLWM